MSKTDKRRTSFASGQKTPKSSHNKSSSKGKNISSDPRIDSKHPRGDYLSFIFIINELPVNDNPDNGGPLPRLDQHNRWLPPDVAAGYRPQRPGRVYRWSAGVVREATEYRWVTFWIEGPPSAHGTLVNHDNNMLACYKTATVFFCNRFTNFVTTPGDASARNIVDGDPEYSWHPLTFMHEDCEDGYISQVEHGGDEQHLAGPGGSFVQQLLPQAYHYQPDDDEQIYQGVPNSKGLAGNLAILIALVAFSCRHSQLHTALTTEHAWQNGIWVPHSYSSGRRDGRGMVVTVFFDPENPTGSTPQTLWNFEFGRDAVFS